MWRFPSVLVKSSTLSSLLLPQVKLSQYCVSKSDGKVKYLEYITVVSKLSGFNCLKGNSMTLRLTYFWLDRSDRRAHHRNRLCCYSYCRHSCHSNTFNIQVSNYSQVGHCHIGQIAKGLSRPFNLLRFSFHYRKVRRRSRHCPNDISESSVRFVSLYDKAPL